MELDASKDDLMVDIQDFPTPCPKLDRRPKTALA
jgi:hypothetical protein